MTAEDTRRWALDADRLPLGALGGVTDLVVVFDHDGTILWATPYTLELLGFDQVDDLRVVGRNIAEFVHPEDMLRAIEVMTMLVDDSIPVPVTPALYRLLREDGTWVPVELNGAVLTATEHGELLAIVGRYSGDRDVQDRIVERLTAGTAGTEATQAIALVPEFGLWRHPHELYGVWYVDDVGHRVMTGSPRAAELAAVAADGTSPWATAVAKGREVIGSQDDLAEPLRSAASAMGFGTCWAIPVPDPLHGEPAVVLVWSAADDRHARAHRFALETMATSLTLILQWRAQVRALEEAARRDPLTGTANRARLFDLLDQLAKTDDDRRAVVGFLYVDLDSFKEVNDLYGHSSGDAVLCEVVRRITGVLRPGDVLARLGGDEFAVVCPGLPDEENAAAALTSIAERIIDAVSTPMRIGGNEVAVGASIGIAITDSASLVADELIDRADQALYTAKTSGRGRWHVSGADEP